MIRKTGTAILLGLFLVFAAAAQERFVQPVDEAAKDPSFMAFREKLIEAAERRDSKYILSIVDPKIRLSFGGDAGIADFKKMWKIDQPDTKFWEEFLPVIKNGGSFLDDPVSKTVYFYAPYSFRSFPDDLSAFDYDVVFGTKVNLREQPSVDSPVRSTLSYNIVKVTPEKSVQKKGEEGYEWFWVETLGGQSGFVKSDFIRSPIDYRAGFAKRNGRWKVVTFIAGD